MQGGTAFADFLPVTHGGPFSYSFSGSGTLPAGGSVFFLHYNGLYSDKKNGVGEGTGFWTSGSSRADHMSAIENGGDVEFRAIYLCRLGNAGVCLPPRTLETKKRGAAVDVDTRYAETARPAHDNAEVLVSQLKWPFPRCSLDLNEVAFVLS
jgi:hypothetical protein